jgi:hypothetical protein
MVTVEEKSMVPTVIVGVGGTGAEVLARVRRLVEETYGSLNNFPLLSFLLIDTDKDYKITNPEAGGTPLKDNEKHWAKVTGKEVQEIVRNMENYPWINRWFPNELEKNISGLEAGAGQIRACGRFALFCNYKEIETKFFDAVSRVKGRENFMLNRHNIKVVNNAVNVFVTASLSGGTGSGMLIDIGYAIRSWLRGESSALVTAIVPMPQAFAGVSVGDRILANGYAAMMELNYFSDNRTEYANQFSTSLTDEIKSDDSPFDFTYLVGTKNGQNDFKLEQIREMMAQNIFLDLTSDFSPHKRSIRDNIKGAWADKDPGGRGYSKKFMSFGISTIEIPISQIRTSLSYRLAADLVNWWLNKEAILPAQMSELVKGNLLKRMRLTDIELLMDLAAAGDRPYDALIVEWINSIRREIETEDLLECTQQGVKMFGAEKGKILNFISGYLEPKVNEYRRDHLNELGTDERLHGDYFNKIYDNRNEIIIRGRKALEDELYRILEDRTQGPKFAANFLISVKQIFTNAEEKFRKDKDDIWGKHEQNAQKQYSDALKEINEYKDKFGISKKEKMEQYCEQALEALQSSLIATVQRKTREEGVKVIEKLQQCLSDLENRFHRWNQKLVQARDLFTEQAEKQANSAEALVINGIKLYERQELNVLYQDFIEQSSGENQGANTRYENGLNSLCGTVSENILQEASPLWKQNRQVDEFMRLFDITKINDLQDDDFQDIIFERSQQKIKDAPSNSKLKRDLAACDRLLKTFNNDEAEIVNNIRLAYQKSKPLVLLNKAVIQGKDAGFTPKINQNSGILGGLNTSDPAAQKILPSLQQFLREDDIKPIGETERHRLVFVQEIGGFSLRCIDGMQELREAYRDWKSQSIIAKRAQQAGESRDLPIPVHIQKEPPFWDLFPEDPQVFELAIKARALETLYSAINKKTKETVIRYTKKTVIGNKNIDLASSWEEVPQVLAIKACRQDREEVESQVNQKLHSAETNSQKQNLYQQLMSYLTQRALELDKEGGKDSLEYKREANIIEKLIENYQLNIVAGESTDSPTYQREQLPVPQAQSEPTIIQVEDTSATSFPAKPEAASYIFCSNCGAKNPRNFKFCSTCGTKLTK